MPMLFRFLAHFLFFRYSTLSDSDLLQLPVHDLCADNALVLVWVTNKLRQQRFVKDRLFPYWHVTCMAEWYWLKVDYSMLWYCDYNKNANNKSCTFPSVRNCGIVG